MAPEDAPLPAQPPEVEAGESAPPVAGSGEDVDENTDPATLLEQLKSISDGVSEHKGLAAAAVVGAAAVTVAAIVAQKKGYLRTPEGHKLFIKRGDRRSAQGVVSLVELTEPGGSPADIAVSFPVGSDVARALEAAKDRDPKVLFALGREGFDYPLRDGERSSPFYGRATRRAAGWLFHVASAGKNSSSES